MGRFVLHFGTCTTSAHPQYDFYGTNDEPSTTGLKTFDPANRMKLTPDLYPISHASKLIFTGFKFTSAGSFKVCLCDGKRATGGCTKDSDFAQQVGTAEVSGVSCLLKKKELRSKNCVNQ